MTSATLFAGGALSEQSIQGRSAVRSRPQTSARLHGALVLFGVLAVQLTVRILVVERAYELESLRSRALKNDVYLRELQAKYAEASGPSLVASRAKLEIGLEALPPQRMRKFLMTAE